MRIRPVTHIVDLIKTIPAKDAIPTSPEILARVAAEVQARRIREETAWYNNLAFQLGLIVAIIIIATLISWVTWSSTSADLQKRRAQLDKLERDTKDGGRHSGGRHSGGHLKVGQRPSVLDVPVDRNTRQTNRRQTRSASPCLRSESIRKEGVRKKPLHNLSMDITRSLNSMANSTARQAISESSLEALVEMDTSESSESSIEVFGVVSINSKVVNNRASLNSAGLQVSGLMSSGGRQWPKDGSQLSGLTATPNRATDVANDTYQLPSQLAGGGGGWKWLKDGSQLAAGLHSKLDSKLDSKESGEFRETYRLPDASPTIPTCPGERRQWPKDGALLAEEYFIGDGGKTNQRASSADTRFRF